MGRRGPAPKSPKLKLLGGNAGKRKIQAATPATVRGIPVCPSWLSAEAKAAWGELVPKLDQAGMLTAVDGLALACLCQAWAEFEISTRQLEGGRTFTTEKGYVGQHPAVTAQRSAWAAIKSFSALFGLDPMSRSKLQLAPPPAAPSPFELYLSRGQKPAKKS